ncbi:hypothetical protein AGMMS49960_01010 [Betaproteobacteria bacterium]|nr:hypothetical protein AGMMS49543_22440 [Betaproteobacteria bacterium]GHT98276.1 hypothetical protein AGMMS49960_01010 [Betaproteobacteria bacterium]GHU23152.1 hypothetical protein AGMMS50243_24040 [Betaproteobacteria bacterium]
MAYVLEEITPEDQQKIIDDADAYKKSGLIYAQKDGSFAKDWAVDRERNHYLLMAPTVTGEDIGVPPYYIFTEGRMYLIRRNGWWGYRFFFDEKNLPPQEKMLRVQRETELAFRCHGSHGESPRSEIIAEMNFFIPPR